MTTSAQVKKWLKDQDVEVKRIRSINGKRNGQKVTHYIEARSGSLTPIFPLEMRREMLKIVYGEDFKPRTSPNPNAPSWVAGNITPHCVNMSPSQWGRLMALMIDWRSLWFNDEVVV